MIWWLTWYFSFIESNSSSESRDVSAKTRSGKRKASGDRGTPRREKRVDSGGRERKEDSRKRQRTAEPEPTSRGTKRKASADIEDNGRKRQKISEPEQKPEEAISEETSLEAFEAKYQQLEELGVGGQGSVYAGHRRADLFPVAIKHIPREKGHIGRRHWEW